ncbi:MAG: hypothetical protein ACI9G1_003563, partial [Pirellulaceae bacterium]
KLCGKAKASYFAALDVYFGVLTLAKMCCWFASVTRSQR